MTRLPIPIHVGSEPLDHWDDVEARQRQFAEEAAPWLQKQRRPAIASPTLDWAALGFEPRWVGFDTVDCAVALQPSVFSGHGADEFDRFRRGAEGRGETALVISPIGDVEDKPRSVLFQHDDSVSIGQSYTSVSSRPILAPWGFSNCRTSSGTARREFGGSSSELAAGRERCTSQDARVRVVVPHYRRRGRRGWRSSKVDATCCGATGIRGFDSQTFLTACTVQG
jgi:hypothetical protein